MTSVADIIDLLDLHGLETKARRVGDRYMICCPLAEWTHERGTDRTPSMSFSEDDEGMWYYCFGCQAKGPMWRLLRTLAMRKGFAGFTALADDMEGAAERSTRTILDSVAESFGAPLRVDAEAHVPGLLLESFERMPIVGHVDTIEAMHYIVERGLDIDTIEGLGWRYDKGERRFVAPLFVESGRFGGLVGRLTYETQRARKVKMYHGTLTRQCLLMDRTRVGPDTTMLLLVEGMTDVANVTCALNALDRLDVVPVSTLSADVSEAQMRWIESLMMEYPVELVCMFDNDVAGSNGWDKLVGVRRARQRVSFVRRYQIPIKREDKDGLVAYKDPGELTVDEMSACLSDIEK